MYITPEEDIINLICNCFYCLAAGWWEPSYDPDTPAELVADWAGQTYNLLLSLWRSQPDEEDLSFQ